ncbi:MAG: carbonic anhydrase family protein [Prochloraceae cyanobacterium]
MLQRRTFLKYVSAATAGAAFSFSFPSLKAALSSEGEGNLEWDYDRIGPESWGELSPDYRVCEMGTQQSPINLKHQEALHANNLNDLEFNYHLSTLKILNNGHTIQINPDPDNHLKIAGKNYDLLQFHFHHPSEHVVSGKNYPMEAHLVHRHHESGELAVLGVFLEEGTENDALSPIWKQLPEHQSKEQPVIGHFNPMQILPHKKIAYRYNGSLTTPPCSQIVHWVVFEEPIKASKQQLTKFAQIFPNNARPVQPGNHRLIIEG